MSEFSHRVIDWQRVHGRRDLPWQGTRDAYRVWLSEIMLQQTQVAAVIPYYARFLARFPDLATLAAADLNEVLGLWSGLGYYARGRNLHRAARIVMDAHGGVFPATAEDIARLPGVGRSTAAAIAVFTCGARAAILDGNVKRVLARAFGIDGFPGERAVEQRLWALAESLLPERDVEAYTQGLMDLGATVCTRGKPACARCPLKEDCVALREDRIARLPTPRPRRERPRRTWTVLLLRHHEAVMLERRPAPGIWGGLLAPPQLPSGEEATNFAARLGCTVDHVAALPVLHHAFTHFDLALQPLLCTVARVEHGAAEPGTVWLGKAEVDAAPLPAPVRALLMALPG